MCMSATAAGTFTTRGSELERAQRVTMEFNGPFHSQTLELMENLLVRVAEAPLSSSPDWFELRLFLQLALPRFWATLLVGGSSNNSEITHFSRLFAA
jgi:hypothetical protein